VILAAYVHMYIVVLYYRATTSVYIAHRNSNFFGLI
jgi:hypothetical protein